MCKDGYLSGVVASRSLTRADRSVERSEETGRQPVKAGPAHRYPTDANRPAVNPPVTYNAQNEQLER